MYSTMRLPGTQLLPQHFAHSATPTVIAAYAAQLLLNARERG